MPSAAKPNEDTTMGIGIAELKASALFDLRGKTAVLTGASGFLGRTFALALLANGARVVALGRSGRLQDEATRWENQFGKDRIATHRIDMYDVDALNAICTEIAEN
jgi:gluconate 5-dehydrogenase